jgi:cell division septation protein DedD
VVVPQGEQRNGQFALQVGAYSSRENAEKQKLFFEDQGYPVEVINRVRDSRSLFLVLVGNYLTYDDAKSRIAEIRQRYGVDSFVVSR